jgi:putative chitinase
MAVLKLGSTGPDVTALQTKLKSLGFNPGESNGVFGDSTRIAVLHFQQSSALLADGVVGHQTATALGLDNVPDPPSAIPAFTVKMVSQMFPHTRVENIQRNLPPVLDALVPQQLTDKKMVLMALATIRAETESFVPISEGQSQFNTSPGGHPFDLYDNRKDLGNQGPPDGERFRGRGFVQLTGRDNYRIHSVAIGLGTQLIENPELANGPDVAARLLASFIKSKERQIKEALLDNNLKLARRLVNGGSNGLDRFSDAFVIGDHLVPEEAAAAAGSTG